MNRSEQIGRLEVGTFDVLVVGAGIVGSRIAYEAARHGLRVALVDAGDFGGATSSASSKLVHGGLRYLATGDLRLVRRLQAERRTLMTAVAPHLVRPLPLLLVVERDHAARAATLVAALGLYAAVAGPAGAHPRLVGKAHAQALVPPLDRSAVTACGVVAEAQTNDARLTLATVRGAGAAGALTLNYVSLIELLERRGTIGGAVLRDKRTGDEVDVRCRVAINATGPWVDEVRRLADPQARRIARLSKGVHALLPLASPWPAGLAVVDGSRTAIAVPWQGMLLVGATDTGYDAHPAELTVEPHDVEEALAPLSRVLSADVLRRENVVHTTAGLRVLPRGPGDTAAAPRQHLVEVGRSGLVSVAGGKLTDHRRIALDVLRRLPFDVRPRTSRDALPGASHRIDGHLAGLYGSEAQRVLAYAETDPDALDRLSEHGPDIVAQVHFARDEEHALTVDDVVCRRTTLAARGLADDEVRARVAEILAASDACSAGRRRTRSS